MKKIMFNGFGGDITEARIRERLERVGPVIDVTIIQDEGQHSPVVVVVMDIDDQAAFRITSRVTEYWHDGHMLNARLLLH